MAKRKNIKRYQPVFCLMVFAILGLGFYQEHVGRVGPVRNFPFPEEANVELEKLLIPGGSHAIAGRILNHEGQPAAGVQISLQRREPREDGAEPLHWAVSDAYGRYALHSLEALEYDVMLYLPGVPIGAEQSSVQPPLDGERDFSLAPPTPAVEAIPDVQRADLIGVVILPAGRLLSEHPLLGYDLALRPALANEAMTGAVTRHTALDSIGLFKLKALVLGPYRLELLPAWATGGSWPVVGSMDWEHQGGDDAREVLFRLRAGAVTGLALDVDSNPVEGALVKLWPEAEPGHVWPMARTDAEGRVTIVDLPEGRYVVRVRAGSASSEVLVDVKEGITSGLSFTALDPGAGQTDD
jgi:hypothetical protein